MKSEQEGGGGHYRNQPAKLRLAFLNKEKVRYYCSNVLAESDWTTTAYTSMSS